MIKNNKASVSCLGIYIVITCLFLMILSKSLFLENYYYFKYVNKQYDLFLIENAIISNIYQEFNNVNYHSENLSYQSTFKIENNEYLYKIKLKVYKDIYNYSARYDRICNRLLEFNNENNLDKKFV